jgi:serine protease Do
MAVIIEDLVENVTPTDSYARQFSDELAALAAKVSASVVVVRGTRNGGGSGVVWNDQGLVVTNAHVAQAPWAEVELPNRTRLRAQVVARSRLLDLAALQIVPPLPSSELIPAAIGDSARLNVGELVVAVGNPLGERNAITLGIVGGTGPTNWPDGQRDILRLSITLRPGNSGGALADVQGRIVGIPHMVVGQGLALAIPSRVVSQFLRGETTN